MRKEDFMRLLTLAITIIILVTLAIFGFKYLLGTNGVLEKVTTEEVEFNKTEILEELNFIITEQYVSAYQKTQDFTAEKIIQYLKGYSGGETGEDYSIQDLSVIIEDLVGVTDAYYINIAELKIDISNYGNGENKEDSKNFFFIKKESEENYTVYYRNSNKEDEEIGNLEFNPEI